MTQALLSWVPRINITKQILSTPTITASSPYVSGYQIGGIMTLSNVIRQDSNFNGTGTGFGQSELHSVKVIDSIGQDQKYDIWIFSSSPTLTNAGDFTAFSITGANALAAGLQGAVSVGATYSASAVAAVSTDGQNLSLNCIVPSSATNPTNLYAVAIVRGTPTFTGTGNLTFLFNFYMD